jgi:hypothetical protein
MAPNLDWRDLAAMLPLWLSNPLMWVGLFLWTRRCYRASAVTALFAVIAGSFLPGKPGEFEFIPGLEVDAGYYVWLGSMLMLLEFSIVGIVAKARNRSSIPLMEDDPHILQELAEPSTGITEHPR